MQATLLCKPFRKPLAWGLARSSEPRLAAPVQTRCRRMVSGAPSTKASAGEAAASSAEKLEPATPAVELADPVTVGQTEPEEPAPVEPAAADTEEGPAGLAAAGGAKAAAAGDKGEGRGEAGAGSAPAAAEGEGRYEVSSMAVGAGTKAAGTSAASGGKPKVAGLAPDEGEEEDAGPAAADAESSESDIDYAAVLERLSFLMSPEMGGEPEQAGTTAVPPTPPPTPALAVAPVAAVSPVESKEAGEESGSEGGDDNGGGCHCPTCLTLRSAGAVEEGGAIAVREPLLSSFDLQGVAELIKSGKVRRIICMCGAGISVSAGIPDFRTPGSGLYHRLEQYDLPYPQAVFEIDFFRENPRPFFLLAKELFPGTFKPTPTHYFMQLLHKKGLLQRCFTQNIDSLEHQAGLPKDAVVAAHGNFDSARCIRCGRRHSVEHVRQAVFSSDGNPCYCSHKGCGGLVKPEIVFFGENLPERFWQLVPSDFGKADLLIVMGTSLVVQPFASLIERVGPEVPRLLVNRERAGEAYGPYGRGFRFDKGNYRDALFEGDCDAGVRELCRLLGWEDELDVLIEAGLPPEATAL